MKSPQKVTPIKSFKGKGHLTERGKGVIESNWHGESPCPLSISDLARRYGVSRQVIRNLKKNFQGTPEKRREQSTQRNDNARKRRDWVQQQLAKKKTVTVRTLFRTCPLSLRPSSTMTIWRDLKALGGVFRPFQMVPDYGSKGKTQWMRDRYVFCLENKNAEWIDCPISMDETPVSIEDPADGV